MKRVGVVNNNCNFEGGGMVVVSSPLSGSSEQLGQPADHFRGKQSFGTVGIWKPESQSFGTVRKGLLAGVLPRALTFEAKVRKDWIEKGLVAALR